MKQKNILNKNASMNNVAKSSLFIMIIGIIFIATNLRAPLTSVGPIVGLIRDDLQISNTMAGMVTTLPLLAFALFSPIVPKLGAKFGVERVIFGSVILLTIGISLRSISGVTTLYIGTAILGIAISVGNVLLPSLIKQEFPEKIGVMTGVYSISMNLFGAIASGVSIPIAIGLGLGWRGALGVWAVLSFISILCWLPQVKKGKKVPDHSVVQQEKQQKGVNLWGSALAWQITLFMGLQSMIFYVLVAWLPEILKQQGLNSSESGWLLSVMLLALLPFTFIVPVIAGRMSNQVSLVIITGILFLTGTFGLLYGSTNLTTLWIISIGVGSGFSFSLAMMFFGLRAQNARQAAELSGMAQSVGYLLAAVGPTLFGYIHDATNNWTAPLYTLIGAAILLLLCGVGAAKDRQIGAF